MRKHWFFYLILILTFLLGGIIQLLGIASNSLMTIGITVLIVLNILFNIVGKRKKIKLKLGPYAVLTGLIVASAVINYTAPSIAFLYFWMFTCVPFTIYYLVKDNLPKIEYKNLINFLLFIGVIQLPFIIMEISFYSFIAPFASRQIAKVDFAFGTFFLANDHALCFLIISLFTLLLFTNYKTPYFNKGYYLCWLAATVIISDSKISFLLLGLVFITYIITNANTKIIIASAMAFMLIPLVLFLVPEALKYVEEKAVYISNKIAPDDSVEQYSLERVLELRNAERSQIFTYYTNKPIKLIGEGPYNYWDPITKKFNLFPNYSQVLWFYNDLGIFSILALAFLYCYFYFKNNKGLSYKIIYLGLILVYTYFSNTLSDLAFNIIFFIFIFNPSRINLIKTSRKHHEHSLHPIP